MTKGILWATLSEDSINDLSSQIIKCGNIYYSDLIPPYHYHITLYHGIEVNHPEVQRTLGLQKTIIVDRLCFDSKIAAIPVNLFGSDLSSININPHITWLLAPEVLAFESNKMLSEIHNVYYFPPTNINVILEYFPSTDPKIIDEFYKPSTHS
jgi:hypothetical protein